MKKGDRVECMTKKGLVYGTIRSIRKDRITMVYDGGEYQISGGSQFFKLSDKPLPEVETDPMSNYEVTKYRKVHGHDDSEPFVAIITLNGKPIIEASNDGWGGCNQYGTLKDIPWSVVDKFHADCKEWAIHYGDANPFEPDSYWIFWSTLRKPFGMTARKYWNEIIAEKATWHKVA